MGDEKWETASTQRPETNFSVGHLRVATPVTSSTSPKWEATQSRHSASKTFNPTQFACSHFDQWRPVKTFRPVQGRKRLIIFFFGAPILSICSCFFFSSVHRREPLVRTERTRSWLLLLLLLLLLSVVQRPIKGRTRASRDPPQRSRFLRRRWSHGDTAGYIN